MSQGVLYNESYRPDVCNYTVAKEEYHGIISVVSECGFTMPAVGKEYDDVKKFMERLSYYYCPKCGKEIEIGEGTK